jgi:SNF2 family DNA or RNA helicase
MRATKLKTPHARQSKAAHRLGAICQFALCLTGTPIGNRPFDLWSQFKFLVPELIVEGELEQTFTNFKNRFACFKGFNGFEINKYRDLPELAKIIRPYVRSAKKEDYLTLPKKNFIEVPVEMGEKSRKLYKQMEKEFVAAVDESTSIVAPIVLAKLTKLSQISGGFIRDTESEVDHPVHRSKLEVLQGICDDLVDAKNKRVVIFARFLWEIDEIRKITGSKWVTYEVSGRVKDFRISASWHSPCLLRAVGL